MHPTTVLHLGQKEIGSKAAGTLPKLGFVSEKKKTMLAAFYNVVLQIAKAKKSHDITKKLIKSCALEMVEHICGIKAKQMIQAILLSNETILQHISEMSQDIYQVIKNTFATL